jgi:phosphoribosylanthranilate isomerase
VATKVKICGITTLEDARLAADAGAWAIGMIFVPESPRAVDVGNAEQIGAAMHRRLEVAGVFSNAPLDEVAALADLCGLTLLQLHGDEGPAYCREAARRTGARVIKAVQAKDPASVRTLRAFHTDLHLLDAYDPGRRGGTGRTFHWEYARHRAYGVPLILSGGIDADNAAAAIAAVHPFALDSASGTEAAPGRKDPARITALMRAVREADPVSLPAPGALMGAAEHAEQEELMALMEQADLVEQERAADLADVPEPADLPDEPESIDDADAADRAEHAAGAPRETR